jgi:thiamine biosynthesis protein ThiS
MTEQESITIVVNGEARSVPSGLTVTMYLEHLELDPRMIVVEHNRAILDRTHFSETPLRDGDVVELVHFVGGG